MLFCLNSPETVCDLFSIEREGGLCESRSYRTAAINVHTFISTVTLTDRGYSEGLKAGGGGGGGHR